MRYILALLLAFGLAGPAVAAEATSRPTSSGDPASSRNMAQSGLAQQIAGATVRAEIWTGHLNEQHIWRFRTNGTLDGSMWAVESGWRSSRHIEVNDSGTWKVENGRLCVTWRRFFGGGEQCYTVAASRPGWVRLTNQSGGPSFLGQLSR